MAIKTLKIFFKIEDCMGAYLAFVFCLNNLQFDFSLLIISYFFKSLLYVRILMDTRRASCRGRWYCSCHFPPPQQHLTTPRCPIQIPVSINSLFLPQSFQYKKKKRYYKLFAISLSSYKLWCWLYYSDQYKKKIITKIFIWFFLVIKYYKSKLKIYLLIFLSSSNLTELFKEI